MGSRNPMIIQSCLKGEALDRWNTLYDNQELVKFSGGMYVGNCPTCLTLRNIYIVKATTNDGTHIELGGTCGVCGSKCIPCDEKKILCPHCGETELGVTVDGLWD